jgi:hypothetical protein
MRWKGTAANLDVPARVEAVQLVDDFKHGALHLIVATLTVVEARPSDAVNLVKKDQASLFGPRHLEHLSDHSRALADVFLHQLRPHNSDEARIGAVGASSR